jgi:microcystin-dependent protein
MGSPYIGEIRIFAGNFAPVNWALCLGQLVPIFQNDALFNLIGTTYGGDGQTTFALPDLRSRVPLHQAANFVIGQSGGVETVTLTVNQIPAHNHVPQGSTASGSQSGPGGGVWAASNPPTSIYSNLAPSVAMNAQAIGNDGGSQPHDNMMPFLVINFIICVAGIFPSQF